MNRLQLKKLLEQLTTTYGADLDRYYQELENARKQLRYYFPGLTIVLCEVHDRNYTPAMVHALVPEMASVTHTIGWHDTFMARLSLDDGKTTLSDVEACELEQDGSWLAGKVEAGGPANQSYILTTPDGKHHYIKHGDTIRNIAFKMEED